VRYSAYPPSGETDATNNLVKSPLPGVQPAKALRKKQAKQQDAIVADSLLDGGYDDASDEKASAVIYAGKPAFLLLKKNRASNKRKERD
jgi:hypothetical protein